MLRVVHDVQRRSSQLNSKSFVCVGVDVLPYPRGWFVLEGSILSHVSNCHVPMTNARWFLGNKGSF